MITYRREFEIHSAHFNTEETYENRRMYRANKESKDYEKALMHLEKCFIDMHGHNFKIIIEVTGESLNEDLFLIDDEALEEIVMQWHRTNLVEHPDFKNTEFAESVSLEAMTVILHKKIKKITSDEVVVTIYETDQQKATYTEHLPIMIK